MSTKKLQLSLKNSFIHLFELGGYKFLFDVPTSVALKLDNIAYDFINNLRRKSYTQTTKTLSENYSAPNIESTLKEFNTLRKFGLFSDFKFQEPKLTIENIQSYKPNHFVLMISQKCNLQCKYCFGEGGNYGEGDTLMPIDIAFKAVDLIVENSLGKMLGLTFFGGEPLLNFPSIVETVQYAKNRAEKKRKIFQFSITTNGTLLTKKIIDFFRKEKFNILLSFDGPKEVHDSMRIHKNGQGSFYTVYRNATRLIKSDLDFAVRATLTHNCVSLIKLSKFFTNEHFPRIHIHTVSPIAFNNSAKEFQLNSKDYDILLEEYEELALRLIDKYKDGKSIMFDPFRIWVDLLKNNIKKLYACGVCRGMSAISADGLIYPCHRFVGMRNYIIGDLDNGINSPRVYEIFKRYYETREICNSCWVKFLCAGGCMYDWAKKDGSFIKEEDENCRLTRKIISLSILLSTFLIDKSLNRETVEHYLA